MTATATPVGSARVAPALLLSVPEVAAELGCGRDTVYGLMTSGQLPSVRIAGRLRRVRRTDLDAYVTGLVPSTPGAVPSTAISPTNTSAEWR